MRDAVPGIEEAPRRLRNLEGNCGPLAAWCALRVYNRRVSAEHIIQSCAHTHKYGVFTIAMATALHRHGLQVSFHTRPDANLKPVERRHYAIARAQGLAIRQPVSIDDLLASFDSGHLPIVFYDTPSGEGHFSPLVGEEGGSLLLPYSGNGRMSRSEFEAAWDAEEILRQAVVVHGRRGNAA